MCKETNAHGIKTTHTRKWVNETKISYTHVCMYACFICLTFAHLPIAVCMCELHLPLHVAQCNTHIKAPTQDFFLYICMCVCKYFCSSYIYICSCQPCLPLCALRCTLAMAIFPRSRLCRTRKCWRPINLRASYA